MTVEKYIAGAYLVAVVLVLAYVLIIASRLQRLERALDDLSSAARASADEPGFEPTWPAASDSRKHDRSRRG